MHMPKNRQADLSRRSLAKAEPVAPKPGEGGPVAPKPGRRRNLSRRSLGEGGTCRAEAWAKAEPVAREAWRRRNLSPRSLGEGGTCYAEAWRRRKQLFDRAAIG